MEKRLRKRVKKATKQGQGQDQAQRARERLGRVVKGEIRTSTDHGGRGQQAWMTRALREALQLAGPARAHPGVGVLEVVRRAARTLPEGWRQHAWHCILDMANPEDAPSQYSYGITGAAQDNVRATFQDLEPMEMVPMMIELLNVLSMVAPGHCEGSAIRGDPPQIWSKWWQNRTRMTTPTR